MMLPIVPLCVWRAGWAAVIPPFSWGSATLALALGAALFAQVPPDHEGTSSVLRERDCGAYAAAIALAGLHAEVPPVAELVRELEIGDDGLCSLASIAQALRERGLDVRDAPVSRHAPDALVVFARKNPVRDDGPAHFVVARPSVNGEVVLYDPPFVVGRMPWHEAVRDAFPVMIECRPRPWLTRYAWAFVVFGAVGAAGAWVGRGRSRAISGVVLLFCLCACSDPVESDQSGGLVIEPSSTMRIDPKLIGKHTIEIALVNRGPNPLRVLDVLPSCACAGYSFDRSAPLAPGERRTAKVDLQISTASRIVAIHFRTDQGPGATLSIDVPQGIVNGVRLPPEIDLGPIPLGMPAQHTIKAHLERSAQRLADLQGRIGSINWRSDESAVLRIQRQGEDYVPADRLPLDLQAQVTITPMRPGPGEAKVSLLIGLVTLDTQVRWTTKAPFADGGSLLKLLPATEGGLRGSMRIRLHDDEESVTVASTDPAVQAAITRGDSGLELSAGAAEGWARGSGRTELLVSITTRGGTVRTYGLPCIADI